MSTNKPVAYISKNNVLFKELPPEGMDLTPLYTAEQIEYWKEMFEKAMSLNEHVKHLEAQVYGGSTK